MDELKSQQEAGEFVARNYCDRYTVEYYQDARIRWGRAFAFVDCADRILMLEHAENPGRNIKAGAIGPPMETVKARHAANNGITVESPLETLSRCLDEELEVMKVGRALVHWSGIRLCPPACTLHQLSDRGLVRGEAFVLMVANVPDLAGEMNNSEVVRASSMAIEDLTEIMDSGALPVRQETKLWWPMFFGQCLLAEGSTHTPVQIPPVSPTRGYETGWFDLDWSAPA